MTGLTATGVGAGGAGAGVVSSARLESGFTSATTRAHTAPSSEKRSRMRCIRALRHGRGAHRVAACPWAGPIPAGPAASVSPPSGGFAYLRAGRAAANDFLTVTVTVKRKPSRLSAESGSRDRVEQVRVLGHRSQGDAHAPARRPSRTRTGDQLRLLAVELGRAEDECVRTHLLDHLDLCRDPLRRQLQRLGAHAEDELVPAAGH